jgi:hypothetical protein
MSRTRPSLPIYVVKPDPEDDVYEAEVYDAPIHEPYPYSHSEQFAAAFLGDIIHGLKQDRTSNSKYSPPPPSHIPARPGYSIPGSGSGHDNPRHHDYYDEGLTALWERFRRWRQSIIVIAGAPSGGVIIFSHLTRRGISVAIFILFLIFLGIYNFPGIWEILVNLI